MKFNFGIIKNKKIGFKFKINDKNYNFSCVLKDVKQTKNSIKFIFNDKIFEVLLTEFCTMNIRKELDTIYFIQTNNISNYSGYVGFSMFDTYGFPIEVLQEIIEENDGILDIEGFNILKELQKDKSKNTFKSNSIF